MKTPPDVSGTTRSCSFTSYFCGNLSCKHSLLERILYLGPEESRDKRKDLTPRERRLLDKLIAEYDKVKSEILSSINRGEQQEIDVQPRTHRQFNRKGTEDAERAGVMLELVKLVHKRQALGHNEVSECCSCCICNSSICSYYKGPRHRHSHTGRTNYSSKSSLSRHNCTRSERTVRLKMKNVYSDPCTCTTKLSSVTTIELKKSNTLLQPDKLLSLPYQKMNSNMSTKKHLKQIIYSELSMNRCLRGSMKSLNRKIRGEVKKPFKTITVLIKETNSKLKELLIKNEEIMKSNIQVGRRVGNSWEGILDNTNLLTNGGLVINTKIGSNEETTKRQNFWKPTEKIVRLVQKSTKLIGTIKPASKKAELMQVPKTHVKTSFKSEDRVSSLNLSRNAKHRQKEASQRSCQQKLLAQDNKIRNRKNIKTMGGKVHTKSREIKYQPSHPTCLSEERTSKDCFNLLSLRKARLAKTPRSNCLNIKELIEKSLSDLDTQLKVIRPETKNTFSKKIGAVTSIKDVSKIFLDIEGKQFVKSFTVGICSQPIDNLKEDTKNKVSPNRSVEPGTLKSANNANEENFFKVKNMNKKLDKKYSNPIKQSKKQKLDLLKTIQQDQTLALSGNIDVKATSKSLINNNYSHLSLKSLNSITFSGSNLINLLNQSSVTNSYVPRCLCTTNVQLPAKDNNCNNGHTNDFDRCKVSISACKILTIERQSDSRFSDKTMGLVSSISGKSSLSNKTVESQVHANTMIYSAFEISPFANVQTVYQCQPVKCPNIKRTVVKPKCSKSCLVPHKCESHMSVPIKCDPNKCLKVLTEQLLKCKSLSRQSLREAIATLNVTCPCNCQKCQVAPPPNIQCQRKKSNEKFKKSQSKCSDRCTAPPAAAAGIGCQVKNTDKKFKKSQSKCLGKCLTSLSTIKCSKKKSDKKLKKLQSKCPDKRCRTSTTSIATSQVRKDQRVADLSSVSSPQGIHLMCRPRPSPFQKPTCPCPIQCYSNSPGLLATTTLFIRRCFCKQKLKGNKDIQQCAQMLKDAKTPMIENKAKVKTFKCGDLNSGASLNLSCDCTIKQKSSKKLKLKATNCVCDSEYPKELICKRATSKEVTKVCSNYSLSVEFCNCPCPIPDKKTSVVNKTVCVRKTSNINASSESKWELTTPCVVPVFSITCKPNKAACFKCKSTSKESQKNKSCKKNKCDKSSSSEICKNKKPKPVQCPSIKCKSKPQKPQNSMTVCKAKKSCPSIKNKTKQCSKNVPVCTQKHQASCQSIKCDCKPELNCKCKQSQEGIKVCKPKSPPAEVKCEALKLNKSISACKNSKDSKKYKDSSIKYELKPIECHKSVTVGKQKVKAKCCPSTECKCKQIDPHKNIAVCKNCKLQFKCMPLKCERKSTVPDKNVTVCNVKVYPKCRPSDKCKPHKNTSICEYCKLQMKRKSLVCKCKTTKSHKFVATCKEKEQTKYCPRVEYDCKPIKSQKSSAVCKNCKGNKKIKCEPIESHKCGKICKKNKRINYCPSTQSKCEFVKPHKSSSVCKHCKGKKKIKCTPLICECKSIEPDKCGTVGKKNKLCKFCQSVKCECKCIEPPKKTSTCKKCDGDNKAKCKPVNPHRCEMKRYKHCTPLVCECKPIEHNKCETICKKYCPSVKCKCKPSKPKRCECKLPVKYKCKSKRCQPLKCECSSCMVDCCKDKNNKKLQSLCQDEDTTKNRHFFSFLTRYFTSETEKCETEKHKTKRNVCLRCDHITKASQTSSSKTKSSSKKSQARHHNIEEVCRKCKHNKVRSCTAPKQQMVCSVSEPNICRKRQKQKNKQCKCKQKLSHKNNKCKYDIETEKGSIKTFFMNIFRNSKKNKTCTAIAEKKNVRCPRRKIIDPTQSYCGKVKHSQKKLKKCGSRGDTVSKKSNATTSTCCSESTQCSKKRANMMKSIRCPCQQCVQCKKSKLSSKKVCKQKRCHSNIGDTGHFVKHCHCSSKSCKNASKNNYSNCHQVYQVEAQPNWNARHLPIVENVPYEFEPGCFVPNKHNRDVSLQKIICCDKKSMLKSPSQMVDVKTDTKLSVVERALVKRMCNLEIQNADTQGQIPNNTVGRVPIEVDRNNYQQKRHLPATTLHELELFAAPNEISTIFPYTPRKEFKRKGISKKKVYLNYKQRIYKSPEKSISRKNQLQGNYDELQQKSKCTEKRKIKVHKHSSPRVIYKKEQVKVNDQKQSITSGITRIMNMCISLLTRQKNTTPKPNMSKDNNNCKNKLYQTVSLIMPCKKRHSLVENEICTSSKSDSQPQKLVMVCTKKPKSLANPKFRKHKVGTKYYQDLIPKQQIEIYSQYQSGDACEQVLNVPDISINNKYPDVESQKEILSYFCKPQFNTGKRLNPYARDYTVGYAFRSRKQKYNCHHCRTSGVQSSSRGLFKDAKTETKDSNSRCTSLKIKGILKKNPLQKCTPKRKFLKSKSMSCCDMCCNHKKHTKVPKRESRGRERESRRRERESRGREKESRGRERESRERERGSKNERSGSKSAKNSSYHYDNERSTSKPAKNSAYHHENERSSSKSTKYSAYRHKNKKSTSKSAKFFGYGHKNKRSRSKSGKRRKFNKKHKISRAVGSEPCASTCLVSLTREGRLLKQKPKIQKPLRFRKTCREDCKHMKHMERVKIKKEEKKLKKARSQTKKLSRQSHSSLLQSITNSFVGSFGRKSKTLVPRQKYDTPPTPLFEIHIDSKDYRVLNREQTIYSISEWQRKEMERRTAEARHGKDCKCCICVRSALQQSSHTRKRNDKTNMVLKDPSTVECVCGSKVCDKERKKLIDQLEQPISKQQEQKKPCVCGSKICAREAEISSKGKMSKLKGKGKVKKKDKKKKKKKQKDKKDIKEKREKKKKKDTHKKDKEKEEEKEKRKMEKLREKQERKKEKKKKKKKPDKDKRKKELEKVQEKLERKAEKQKEKLERERLKKELKKPIKPKKTAKELMDERMAQFREARKKNYEDWQKSREFKKNNKYEVAARERHKYYVAKMNRLESHATQERSEPDLQLIAKSIADLWDVSATCVQSAARHSYRRIMQPEPKEKHIKRQNFKTNQYVVRTTFRNIWRRLLLTKVFGTLGRLGGGSNRYRRKKRSPENWGCNMYMQTLRVKRCVWLYKTCPWFYPYCLNIITVWRHFAFFLMFFIGAILWTPCFFCVELCNLLLCCNC